MAYRALYRWFSRFRKTPFTDWVYWYSEYVLKTPQQRKCEREMAHREAKLAVNNLLTMHTILSSMSDYRW